jgi:hypothetical protein
MAAVLRNAPQGSSDVDRQQRVDPGRSRQTGTNHTCQSSRGIRCRLPLGGCFKLFCRKISARSALRCVGVELYFFGVSARASLGF